MYERISILSVYFLFSIFVFVFVFYFYFISFCCDDDIFNFCNKLPGKKFLESPLVLANSRMACMACVSSIDNNGQGIKYKKDVEQQTCRYIFF